MMSFVQKLLIEL